MDPLSSEGMDIREALTSPLDYTGMPLTVKVEEPVASGAKKKVGFRCWSRPMQHWTRATTTA